MNAAREDYKKVADLAKHVLRIRGLWMIKYELAIGMLRRSLENVDSVEIDDVEVEVRRELNRRGLACEEALDNFEALYHQVEEIRLEKAEKVGYYTDDPREYSDSFTGPSHRSTHRACARSRHRACTGSS